MSEALGEALLYLRTDDRGLDAGISNAKGKSDQLGVAFDQTSGKADNLGKSMDRAGASATRFATEQGKVTTMTNAQRAGVNQLMMQVNDMGTMWSLGARPMQIFTSQMGQVTQAMQLAAGGSSRFATLIGSPWTMAVSTAALVLLPLIANLFDTEDATDKAGKANETWADKLDRSKHSIEEVRAALRDYSAEQRKATETTLDAAQAAALQAAAELKTALALRQKLAAQLAADKDAARASAGQGTGGAAGLYIGGNIDKTREAIAKNDAEIASLTQQAHEAAGTVAAEIAKLETDTTAKVKFEAEERRKAIKRETSSYDEKLKKLKEIDRWEQRALADASKAKRDANASGPSASANASVGDMVALVKQLFPGAIVTSTTSGRHTKGSDHYAGRAIDFVPKGGMGQYSTADVQKILEDAGVSIRRNARGTQQIFGPGRSANSPGDHDNHFHFAWSGSASPEEAQKRAAQAAERAARAAEQEERRKERYNRDLASLQDQAADLQARLADTVEDRYQLEKEGLEISIGEQKRRIEANGDYTDAEKANLLLALQKKATLERELLDKRRAEELARQQLEIAEAHWNSDRELLQKQAALAETREKRRAIEQKLLDGDYELRRQQLEAIQKGQPGYDDAQIALAGLPAQKALDQQSLDRDSESPIERYRRELIGYGDNLNDELEKVAVGALDSIADRLANIAMNADNMMDAIKGIFKQIGVEVMRLVIQQQLILPLLNLLGLGGGGSAPGGAGGGGGLFSSIGSAFAGFFADGGLIPTGSFGIVGEAGPELVGATPGGIGVMPNSAFRQLGGGGGAPSFAISIPIDATGADPAALARVQASVDRLRAELPGQIVQTVQDAGDRRLFSARGWQ